MDQIITIPNGNIHVSIAGEGLPIVLLPGFGDPCPGLMMKPFSEALKHHFKVITYDPFGYGESDSTQAPRTAENISDELHQAMTTLGIGRYVIAAHSISGLYALFHIHRYPEEIAAFIALDMSVPCQFTSEFAQEELTATEKMLTDHFTATSDEALKEISESAIQFLRALTSYPYSEKEIRHYEQMAVKCAHDPTMLDELHRMSDNGEKAKDLTIPDNLPALMLIARENIKRLPEWESWHLTLCGKKTSAHIIESDHYIHLMQTEQTVQLIEQMLL